MNKSIATLFQKLDEYKNKYYKNLLIKGILFTIALFFGAFLLFNTIEYFGRFNSTIRGILFFGLLGVTIYSLIFWIIKPILFLSGIRKQLTNETVAKEIGKFFPEVGDRLLNTLQLANLSDKDNSLLQASIAQKTQELKFIRFADAINFNENKKYLKYALPPLLLTFLIAAYSPKFFTKSTERIVNFRKDFAEEAPFKFRIINKDLKAIKNEDFILNLELVGNAIPENVFLVYNNRKFKMQSKDEKHYDFNFTKIQSEIEFFFEASGFTSDKNTIELISRPNLLSFDVQLHYPSYLNKSSESFDNVGNLVVPEGTVVEWNFRAADTDSLFMIFDGEPRKLAEDNLGDRFSYKRRLKNSALYKILLKNDFSTNRENIDFYINVTPDKFPMITLEQVKDTTLFNYIVLGGNISDDYGLSQFKLFYKALKDDKQDTPFTSLDIPFSKSQISQSYYYQLPLDNLGLKPGDKLEYFLQVFDNDGVNGAKATKTPVMTLALPSARALDKEIEKQANKTEKMFEDLTDKAKKLKNELNNFENRVKSKKDIDFQEKKQLEDLIKKREDLIKEMKDAQQQFDQMQEKQQRFQEQSPELQQKMEQLRQMMNDMLNDETNKMYEELKKMLEKGVDQKVIEQLEKMKNKDRNLDKEIERLQKLMKEMMLEQKVNKAVEELNKLAEKQDKLGDESQKNDKNQNSQEKDKKTEEIKKEQEKLSQEFKEKKEDIKEIEKMSKELKKDVDTDKEDQEDAEEDQKDAEDQLDQKQNNAASKSQKNAAKKMKKMAQKMEDSMKSAEMKELDEDIDALRSILENLVSLSFDQERLMKEFRNMTVSDPRFVKLSQDQLKLQDDAKVIEDSLFSLASRVMQIKSFVTKEVTSMKNSMDESVKFIKERKLNLASAKQQFSMTSINNLALMLSDTFKQMQQMMSQAMPGSGKGKKGKKNSPSESIGKMQEQLNQKMKEMGKSQGMSGRQMSEQLAKMAQEQAQIRKMLKEMMENLKGTEAGKKLGNELKELEKKMDENETDLVNKRVNPELIRRSQDIHVRLLEAEKAIQQQEEDPTRQSRTGVRPERSSPPSLEKFLQDKQKQVELIRTVPPNYTPFYKKQTDTYFQKIK